MTRAVIVGSNRGIGLEICRQLAARGDEVIAACRHSSPELDRLGVDVRAGVDVTERASLDALARAIEPESVDWLVVVAGVLERMRLDALDFDSIRRQFEINAIGPLQTTTALLPTLAKSAKLGLVTSRMGSLADNTSGASYGYRMSKAALNMAGRSLAHDLRPRGVAVLLLHPGWVRTDMTDGQGHIDAGEAAAGLIARMDELTLERSGSFVHQNGDALPW